MELNKIILAKQVDQVLEQPFTKKTLFGFRVMRIWPLNPKAMDNKTKPLKVYTITNMNNARNENDYTTKEEVENNSQWGEESIITKVFHIVEIDQHPTFEDLPIYMLENDQCYYVDMSQSRILI